jgi:hypothetical protein
LVDALSTEAEEAIAREQLVKTQQTEKSERVL